MSLVSDNFLATKETKICFHKEKVLQDTFPELMNHVEKIKSNWFTALKTGLIIIMLSYLICWGHLNIPQEGTNSSLLQTNNFPNSKTYVNGIQLLRKKYQYIFRLYIYNTKKNYMKNTAFPYGKKKKPGKPPWIFSNYICTF
jgi:hypothetical protein